MREHVWSMRAPRPLLTLAVIAIGLASCGGSDDVAQSEAVPAIDGTTRTAPTPTLATTTESSTAPTTAPPTTSTTTPPTACTRVVHIGDSTSVGLISTSYLPDPTQRIDAQYARVGVVEQHLEIDGARSIVETHHGSPNARDTAARLRDAGFSGCWVFALGTTDSANVGAGSNIDHATRIDRMMAVAGNDPVLWTKVKTLVPQGAWSNQNMQAWNRALDDATARYPNLRLLDWPAVVQDSWFSSDGIHYTSEGFAHRARLIADAVAARSNG